MKRITKADREVLHALVRQYGRAAILRVIRAAPARGRGQPPYDPAEVWHNDFQVWLAFQILLSKDWRVQAAQDEIASTWGISRKKVRGHCANAASTMSTNSELARICHAVLDYSLLCVGEHPVRVNTGGDDDAEIVVALMKHGKPHKKK